MYIYNVIFLDLNFVGIKKWTKLKNELLKQVQPQR